ncbi:hypothetical protein ACFSQP_07345 [Bizionia sediminis]|uniref:Uncharacterized protein n=1 Tax=Bizionia sediminis TaxID=1737064 RepID=A0ABW5KRK0_9FLAO
MNSLQKMGKKSSSMGSGNNDRLITSPDNGFIIDINSATYIETNTGDYHSYTFPIYRENASMLLENLLMSGQPDGSYRAFITSYNITVEELQAISLGTYVDLEGKTSYTEINAEGLAIDLFGKLTTNCTYYFFSWCGCSVPTHGGGYDVDGLPCNCMESYTISECIEGSGINNEGGGPTGSTNDPENPLGGGSGPNITTPTYTPQPWENILACMPGLLDMESNALSWLQANKGQASQIEAYIDANRPSPNACPSVEVMTFVIAAISATDEGGLVDWDDNVILDSTVLNNQKVKCVYDKLKGLSNTVFNDIINDHFESAKNTRITFKIANTPNGEDAFTKGRTNNGITSFDILLSPNVVNTASIIEIALMIIHESIHAELLDRCVQLGIINAFNAVGNPNFTNTSITYNTSDALFAILVEQYRNFGGTNSQWNHDLFSVGNYRTTMAQNLVDIHPWLNDASNDFLSNVNNDNLNLYGNFSLQELMEYISWIGLEGTQEFINNIQNNSLEFTKKNYVETAARIEYTNNCN